MLFQYLAKASQIQLEPYSLIEFIPEAILEGTHALEEECYSEEIDLIYCQSDCQKLTLFHRTLDCDTKMSTVAVSMNL